MAATMTEDAFHALKPSTYDDCVVDKIRALLDAYECFKAPSVTDPPSRPSYHHAGGFHHHNNNNNNNHHHQGGGGGINTNRRSVRSSHHHGHGHGHHGHHPSILTKRTVIGGDPDKNVRRVKACLNKITHDNYPKMRKAIQAVVDEDGVEPTVALVLEKCYTQTCFLDLFVCLLCDIHADACRAHQQALRAALEAFVGDYLDRREFMAYKVKPSTTYDDFCESVLHRTTLVGKHKTILALFEQILSDDARLRESYLSAMFGAFAAFPAGESMEIYELLLDLMQEVVRTDRAYAGKVRAYFEAEDARASAARSNKARYKIMDLMETARTA
jgi:hypothetical protein